jgi:hypothetical protein
VASIIERIDFDCSIYLMPAIISLAVPMALIGKYSHNPKRMSMPLTYFIAATEQCWQQLYTSSLVKKVSSTKKLWRNYRLLDRLLG